MYKSKSKIWQKEKVYSFINPVMPWHIILFTIDEFSYIFRTSYKAPYKIIFLVKFSQCQPSTVNSENHINNIHLDEKPYNHIPSNLMVNYYNRACWPLTLPPRPYTYTFSFLDSTSFRNQKWVCTRFLASSHFENYQNCWWAPNTFLPLILRLFFILFLFNHPDSPFMNIVRMVLPLV